MSTATRFPLDGDTREVFRAVVGAYTNSRLTPDVTRRVPAHVLRQLGAMSAVSRLESQHARFPAGWSIDEAWMAHSSASRRDTTRVIEAFSQIAREPGLVNLTFATKCAALSLFTRFLVRVAKSGGPLRKEYLDLRRRLTSHQNLLAHQPVQPRQHYEHAVHARVTTQQHRLWEAPADAAAAQQRRPVADDGDYSVYLCLRECLVLVAAALELDFHSDAPNTIRQRESNEMYCHRLVMSVLGYGVKVSTPLDALDHFFYSVAPSTALRNFDGIVALQKAAMRHANEWLNNPEFSLPPSAPIAGVILLRALESIVDGADDASRAMIEEGVAECLNACVTAVPVEGGPAVARW